MTEVPELPADSGFDLTRDLALALTLAEAADAISLARFGATDLIVESKPDLTPVSDADLAVETAIRELITAQRPDDAIVGEEFGADLPTHGRRWVIDPIDGTKNFVRGVPVWATLIALFEDDKVVLGVVSAPALSRRWWAASGHGAFTSFQNQAPKPCRVSGVKELRDASLSFSELAEWEAAGQLDTFIELTRSCWRTRGYGDFLSYMFVAEGAVDIALEPELNLWDVAALVPIVTEAGGTFTGVDGSAPSQSSASALVTNGHLHQQVLGALGVQAHTAD